MDEKAPIDGGLILDALKKRLRVTAFTHEKMLDKGVISERVNGWLDGRAELAKELLDTIEYMESKMMAVR